MMRIIVIGVLAVVALVFGLRGCGPNPASSLQPQTESKPPRLETKNVEAAGAAGYNAKQVRKSVDKTLDQNDEHNKELEKTMTEK